MPYIVVTSSHQDVECRELSGSTVLGRAPDCQLAVRDILLSRRHCRIERSPHGWLLIDLNSKNGTVVNGQRLVAPRLLQDKDIVGMGRSRFVFHSGVPTTQERNLRRLPRPIDPREALAGTLAGFSLLMPGERQSPQNMPCPQPRPREPAAYEREELHEMLTAIASSSWDSIYAEARHPLAQPAATAAAVREMPSRRSSRPRSPIDLSLQVIPLSPPDPAPALAADPSPALQRPNPRPRPAASDLRTRKRLSGVAAAVCLAAAIVLAARWKTTIPLPRATVASEPRKLVPPAMPALPSQQILRDGINWRAAGKLVLLSLPAWL